MMIHQPQTKFPAVSLQHLLVTTNGRRGIGKVEIDPHRAITEFWTLDGQKVAEVDPCDPHRWMQLQEKLAGMELEVQKLNSEIKEAKRLMEQRDRMILEINTEKKEADDRVRQLEEALRWALGEALEGFDNFEDWCNKNDKPLDTRAPYFWRTELRERAGLAVATSTSLPAADIAP